jgi:hypothetical protein
MKTRILAAAVATALSAFLSTLPASAAPACDHYTDEQNPPLEKLRPDDRITIAGSGITFDQDTDLTVLRRQKKQDPDRKFDDFCEVHLRREARRDFTLGDMETLVVSGVPVFDTVDKNTETVSIRFDHPQISEIYCEGRSTKKFFQFWKDGANRPLAAHDFELLSRHLPGHLSIQFCHRKPDPSALVPGSPSVPGGVTIESLIPALGKPSPRAGGAR